ncbi:MAG: hypothetical protein JSR17_06730 [Proteobacteria bacterium]|nr:hypothetical protein [Pseudomonadota bacterium]
MLKVLNPAELLAVSGGCPNNCKDATLVFLNTCTMEQMIEINKIFKTILLSDEMKNVDNDTKIAALIAAIEASNI